MKDIIKEILDELFKKNIIDISNIPNIDLYVDQLTSFIEENTFSNKENNLTKPMINNYCKNKIIPPSTKKKYDKNHIMMLIIIYNTKSIISISDLKKIFDTFSENEITDYYNTINKLIISSNENFAENIFEDLENIETNSIFDKDSSRIAILATKLAIEANYKKILSELLIEKYL